MSSEGDHLRHERERAELNRDLRQRMHHQRAGVCYFCDQGTADREKLEGKA